MEEYNIESDEEEKINKIKNIGKIKIYRERTKLFEDYNTYNKNNFLISIKDYNMNKEKTESSKNKRTNKDSNFNQIMQENDSLSNNKYDSKDESSID